MENERFCTTSILMAVWEAKPEAIPLSSKNAWEERWTKEVADKWRRKPLHGQNVNQVSSITDEEHAFK